jgi:bifunctional non-homologous end joining protein LigD
VKGLISLAQIGSLEIHAWGSREDKLDHPDRLIFDLDPDPAVSWSRGVEAARQVRDFLGELGLESFLKTTGGKGLHVVTPFKPTRSDTLDWALAKAFALEVSKQMAADSPERYLTNMSKAKRVGRIFLDYLRNDRMATAVAPLSPRARDGAPVSMPLSWTQVKSGLDPMRYTIRTAPALLKKSNAWDDYCDGERPFLPAAKKLVAKRVR